MPETTDPQRCHRGYSLLETLLALALLAGGAVGLLQLYVHSLQSSHDAALAVRATDAAVELLARVRLNPEAPPGAWSHVRQDGGCAPTVDEGGDPAAEWQGWLARLGCLLPEPTAQMDDDAGRIAIRVEWRRRDGTRGTTVLESRR